jgi:hypothetical protein
LKHIKKHQHNQADDKPKREVFTKIIQELVSLCFLFGRYETSSESLL